MTGDIRNRVKELRFVPAGELQAEWGTAAGQLWKVGEHRLVIGDATDPAVRNRVRPRRGWDGVVTDPPYEFDVGQLTGVLDHCCDVACVLCSDSMAFHLASLWHFRLDMIWRHRRPRKLPNTNMPILYHAHILIVARSKKVKTGWTKPRADFGSVIETEQEYASQHEYGKSAELFRAMLAGFEWREVLDPFAGSGASLIACEQDGRRWSGCEISPEMAAICLDRASRLG